MIDIDGRPTLCVTVDNLGMAARIGLGETARPDPDEPGLRALPGLLDSFDDLGITATFFVEGWNGLHHPDAVRSIAARGHEVGLHGWVHEKWSTLTDDQRETLLFDGTASLRSAGVEPRGFRAPGGYRGGRTAEVLGELGYDYDSSIEPSTENDPLVLTRLPQGLVNIPWHWDMIDYYQYHMHPAGPRSPDHLLDHFAGRLAEAVSTGGLVTVILHPFVSFAGDPGRFRVIREFLARAVADPDVDVLSAGQVASATPGGPSRRPAGDRGWGKI